MTSKSSKLKRITSNRKDDQVFIDESEYLDEGYFAFED